MFRTPSPGDSISVALRKLLQGGRRRSQVIYKFAAEGTGSLNIKKIRYQVKEFSLCIWVDERLWAHWIHSFHIHLSYLGPILVHLASCIPPASQQSPWGVTVSLDWSFGSPHSHLEARNRWWLWHVLFIDMAGDIFISHHQTSKGYRLEAAFLWIFAPTEVCLSQRQKL